MTRSRDFVPQRLLGFDFGTRRIGVAVGQMITGTAHPLATIQCAGGKPDWATIDRIVSEWKPDALVVGIPYHMDGSRQPITGAAERFCRQLEGRSGLTVYHADERLSSQAAELLNDGHSLDALAACVILESWMNTGRLHS